MSATTNMRAILIKELGKSLLDNQVCIETNTARSVTGDASQLYLDNVQNPIPKDAEILV